MDYPLTRRQVKIDKRFRREMELRGRALIDAKFGKGFSKKHPRRLGFYCATAFLRREKILPNGEADLMVKILMATPEEIPNLQASLEKSSEQVKAMERFLATVSEEAGLHEACSEIGAGMWKACLREDPK